MESTAPTIHANAKAEDIGHRVYQAWIEGKKHKVVKVGLGVEPWSIRRRYDWTEDGIEYKAEMINTHMVMMMGTWQAIYWVNRRGEL